MVADPLSRKVVGTPIRVVCLRMTVITPIVEQIHGALVKAMKDEHHKNEHIVGHVSSFDYDIRGLLNLHRRIWDSYLGSTR